ncbi:hypothetical protein [Motilibacter deserti]|uniref:Uncharacterized protein n=1 Tax=Motilibacter deserti TaxID=2714956 RepID=A0ABX0GS55_9ACTN|nr:hypothetical protein [Motilibacter deserti]NHC13699.1 hypothetical protein [Motilibacter deserti]
MGKGPDSPSDNHALAQAVHDLGAALWLGGAVMGVAGVNKAGRRLPQGIDRIRVADSAWSRFGPVEWAGIAAMLGAGLRLTQVGKGRMALQQGFATAGMLKAGVGVLGAAATAYSTYTGKKVAKLAEEAHARGVTVDVEDATVPSATTPPEIARWQKRERVAQYVVPVLAGGNIALGSYLVQSYRAGATAKGVAHRLLPGR